MSRKKKRRFPKVRVYQEGIAIKRHGPHAAPWSISWFEDVGASRKKRRTKTIGSKKEATAAAEAKVDELVKADRDREANRAGRPLDRSWEDLLSEYAEHMKTRSSNPQHRQAAVRVLRRFGTMLAVRRVSEVDDTVIDRYLAQRLDAKGRGGGNLSVETVGRELRTIGAALRFAKRKRYIGTVPNIPSKHELHGFRPPPDKQFVKESQFAAMLAALDEKPWVMTKPAGMDAASWWRALLWFEWCTGWRIGQVLKMRWKFIDWDHGLIVAPPEVCKAARPIVAAIGPALPYLEAIKRAPDGLIFPWRHGATGLYAEFHRLQAEVGIEPKAYLGFHDFRRALVTHNLGRASAEQIQAQGGWETTAMMRHYLRYAEEHRPTFQPYVPESAEKRRQSADNLRIFRENAAGL